VPAETASLPGETASQAANTLKFYPNFAPFLRRDLSRRSGGFDAILNTLLGVNMQKKTVEKQKYILSAARFQLKIIHTRDTETSEKKNLTNKKNHKHNNLQQCNSKLGKKCTGRF
jgi:hypothetical protein